MLCPEPAGGTHSAPTDPVAGGEGTGCPSPKTPPSLSALWASDGAAFPVTLHSENPGIAPDREKACLKTLRGNYFDAEGLGLPYTALIPTPVMALFLVLFAYRVRSTCISYMISTETTGLHAVLFTLSTKYSVSVYSTPYPGDYNVRWQQQNTLSECTMRRRHIS